MKGESPDATLSRRFVSPSPGAVSAVRATAGSTRQGRAAQARGPKPTEPYIVGDLTIDYYERLVSLARSSSQADRH